MSLLFSIVLPIYKVEKYIDKCIETCCNQQGVSTESFELILVDDESPDDSIKVAKTILSKYPKINFQIVHRKNGGLSAARNTGIDVAKGEYVWFVDSDDYVSEASLFILSKYLEKQKYDIIRFRHKTIFNNGYGNNANQIEIHPLECDGYSLLARHSFMSACCAIYNRLFLMRNNLKFREGRIWEDSEFNIRAYSLAKHCLEIGDIFYYYIRREDSISDCKATPFSTKSRMDNVSDLITFFKDETNANNLTILSNHICSSVISSIAGLREMGREKSHPFRILINSNRKEYLKWAIYCNDRRIYWIIWFYKYLPSVIEYLLSKRMRYAIKRSQKQISL